MSWYKTESIVTSCLWLCTVFVSRSRITWIDITLYKRKFWICFTYLHDASRENEDCCSRFDFYLNKFLVSYSSNLCCLLIKSARHSTFFSDKTKFYLLKKQSLPCELRIVSRRPNQVLYISYNGKRHTLR